MTINFTKSKLMVVNIECIRAGGQRKFYFRFRHRPNQHFQTKFRVKIFLCWPKLRGRLWLLKYTLALTLKSRGYIAPQPPPPSPLGSYYTNKSFSDLLFCYQNAGQVFVSQNFSPPVIDLWIGPCVPILYLHVNKYCCDLPGILVILKHTLQS